MSGTPPQPSSARCPTLGDSRASALSWEDVSPSTHTPERTSSPEVGASRCRWWQQDGCVLRWCGGDDLLEPETGAGRKAWTGAGRSHLALAPAAVTRALDAQNSPGAGPREPALRLVNPTCPRARRTGSLPPRGAGYLHRGPPWARPGLVQLVGVLRWPRPAYIHVTAATVQLEAVPARERLGHELAEDADAAVPEGGLWEPPHHAPRPRLRVVGLHHVREFKRIVVAPRDVQLPSEDCQAAPHVHLWAKGTGDWRPAARAEQGPPDPSPRRRGVGPLGGAALALLEVVLGAIVCTPAGQTHVLPTRQLGNRAPRPGGTCHVWSLGWSGATVALSLPASSFSPLRRARLSPPSYRWETSASRS